MSTNKDCFKQYRNFSGSMREWFNLCVRESDVFRVWYRDDPSDETCDFVNIIGVIELSNDYLLELKYDTPDCEEGKEHIFFTRLSDIRSLTILANEDDYE